VVSDGHGPSAGFTSSAAAAPQGTRPRHPRRSRRAHLERSLADRPFTGWPDGQPPSVETPIRGVPARASPRSTRTRLL
jgi:hypothetical protein